MLTMKKIYTFLKSKTLSLLVASFCFTGYAATAQIPSICGGVAQNFDMTSGSTGGFTGDFRLGSDGTDGYLVKDRVLAGGVYTTTSPTYQSPAGATFIGYGFTLDGTEKVARAELKLMYISTLNGEMTTVFLGQFVPAYNPGAPTADFCRAVALTDLPGFPSGGLYRLRIELTPNTGMGATGQTITLDDFRTTGTLSLTPLPVNFIGFEAKKISNQVQITWKVAGEENVSHYEVERSEDGRRFTRISSVSSAGKDTYTFTDASNLSTVYYRVKNVDNDGKFKYSTVARLANGRSHIVLKAFPQPVQSQLTIQHPGIEGRALISISSADGRVLRTQVPASGSMQTAVDMSSLQAGMYMIRFDAGDGNVETLKVLKK